jgi:hypothetical protein
VIIGTMPDMRRPPALSPCAKTACGSAMTVAHTRSPSSRRQTAPLRQPQEPGSEATLKRGNESVVAGLHCVDWSWTDDVETRTVCLAADGVLLRFLIDGQIVSEARPPGIHAVAGPRRWPRALIDTVDTSPFDEFVFGGRAQGTYTRSFSISKVVSSVDAQDRRVCHPQVPP